MQKWEYLYVVLHGYNADKRQNTWGMNGVEAMWPTTWAMLNAQGRDGWELITVDQGNYYFKRLKS